MFGKLENDTFRKPRREEAASLNESSLFPYTISTTYMRKFALNAKRVNRNISSPYFCRILLGIGFRDPNSIKNIKKGNYITWIYLEDFPLCTASARSLELREREKK